MPIADLIKESARRIAMRGLQINEQEVERLRDQMGRYMTDTEVYEWGKHLASFSSLSPDTLHNFANLVEESAHE